MCRVEETRSNHECEETINFVETLKIREDH